MKSSQLSGIFSPVSQVKISSYRRPLTVILLKGVINRWATAADERPGASAGFTAQGLTV